MILTISFVLVCGVIVLTLAIRAVRQERKTSLHRELTVDEFDVLVGEDEPELVELCSTVKPLLMTIPSKHAGLKTRNSR